MHPGCQSQPQRMWQLLQNLSIPTSRTIGKEILIRDVPTHETTISNPATRSEASKKLNPAVRAVFTRNSPNPSTYCIGKRRRSLSQTRTGNTKGSVNGVRRMDLLSPRIPHQSLYNPCAHVPSPQGQPALRPGWVFQEDGLLTRDVGAPPGKAHHAPALICQGVTLGTFSCGRWVHGTVTTGLGNCRSG